MCLHLNKRHAKPEILYLATEITLVTFHIRQVLPFSKACKCVQQSLENKWMLLVQREVDKDNCGTASTEGVR